ncbi:ArsR/SmtB family transcription factor [Neomoorella thermoacetica]|uniref:ArsR/SmtB family transcription factor n=1 Tax=Neomoorella thermoacetica TaxID=1525 RepID=UPI0008FB9C13|nr:metalloregulator ArsR/SmtB family transcription factor [Moorella thermoacetica]APC09012.1 cadmium resistance transcriptional regulatory protein CadC [Moorella thermoacetica]OIQ55040.1 cadmium resistance transcriptional regulatory protein CadC [Moorella thermoacetica]
MALHSLPGKLERDAPVCQVNCINEEVIKRLKPRVDKMEGVATVFKALADDTRVKIIYALSEAELCVCDVAALIGSSKATASYHLRLLHYLGLVKYRKEGKLVYYRLVDPSIGDLVRQVINLTRQGTNGG